MRKNKKNIIYLFLIALFFSCAKDDSGSDENEIIQEVVKDQKEEVSSTSTTDTSNSQNQTTSTQATYDRSSFLINIADNIIIPSQNQFKTDLIELQEASNTFEEETNDTNLNTLREKWIVSYKSWQHIEMFNIGRAEEIYYNSKMNIYPVNIDRLENNVSTGNYDLDNANNFSSQGFPALDYLLYGVGSSDSEIIEKFNSGSGYKTYLKDIILKMVNNTNEVIDSWTSYRDVFVSSTENTATSSINKLTNDFIYYYEKGFRANKFGIPVGIFSGGNIFPEKVEAYHNKNVSQILALEALDAIKLFFNGNGSYSLSQYIDNFATDDMENLSNDINSQFDLSRNSIEGLDSNFVNQLNSNSLQMGITYDVIQAGTVLLKTDMLSVLQIATDYVDADGD